MQVSFEWLVDPIGPATFFSRYYEREPLLISRDDPKRFEALLNVAAIDRFLASTPCHPEVFLVDAARKLGAEDYTLPHSEDAALDLPRVYELFRTGATISIRHMHERIPELAALTRELTIRAGDLFYCPRGLFHAARSTGEISLHITLGLMGKTWADVMVEAVSAACLASPAFRANLPAGFADADFDPAQAEAKFRSLLADFARTAEFGPVLERFTQDFVTSRRPHLSGALEELGDASPVTIDTAVEPRPHLIYRLRQDGDKIVLLFGSATIAFPAFVRDSLQFALQARRFVVGELPGRLDDAGKLVLVRRLIQEGLLVRSAAPLAATAGRATNAHADR
jgi:hypothetical protein